MRLKRPHGFVNSGGFDAELWMWSQGIQAVLAALQAREFMPEIKRVESVSSFSTSSTWTVQTHRGMTQFVLRGEEGIRRISAKTLIVADEYGVQFLIRDMPALDRHSRKLLDRFL